MMILLIRFLVTLIVVLWSCDLFLFINISIDMPSLQTFPEILHGVPSNPYTVKYIPPFDEFEVDVCDLPRKASTFFPAIPGPCIFVVVAGEGTITRTASSKESIAEGDALFAPANTEIAIETVSGLKLYRAGVNSRFLDTPTQ